MENCKDDCIFCLLANGVIPTATVYEDDDFRAFLDAAPASPGHTLIVPKQHAANLFELPEETAAKAMRLAKRLAAVMKTELQPDGLNLIQNNGSAAGQTVMHFHLHVIPRFEGVGCLPVWTPVETSDDEKKAMAARLSAAMIAAEKE